VAALALSPFDCHLPHLAHSAQVQWPVQLGARVSGQAAKRVATATYGKFTSMHHIRVASANLGAKGGKLGSLIVTQWSKFTVGPAWRQGGGFNIETLFFVKYQVLRHQNRC